MSFSSIKKFPRGPLCCWTISPKLFTAAIQKVFKNSELESRGIEIDGERLTDLRFADDVALTTSSVEKHGDTA